MHGQLSIETYFMKRNFLQEEDFINFPEEYLVSMEKEPEIVRQIIEQNEKEFFFDEGSFYFDGALHLIFNGKTIIPITQWKDLDDFWKIMINLIARFFKVGYSKSYYPESPVLMILKKERKTPYLFFLVDDVDIYVEEEVFIDTMLKEAKKYFSLLKETLEHESYEEELNQIEVLYEILHTKFSF